MLFQVTNMIATCGLLVAGATLGVAVVRWRRRRRGLSAQRRGRRGERQALLALESRGFTILGEQVVRRYVYYVDGQEVAATLRADLLVSRGPHQYVVEVKTGGAADPGRPNVRRQLLEYRYAFPEAAGVLFADMEQGAIRRVTFPGLGRRPRLGWLLALAALILLGVLLYQRISTHSPLAGG